MLALRLPRDIEERLEAFIRAEERRVEMDGGDVEIGVSRRKVHAARPLLHAPMAWTAISRRCGIRRCSAR